MATDGGRKDKKGGTVAWPWRQGDVQLGDKPVLHRLCRHSAGDGGRLSLHACTLCNLSTFIAADEPFAALAVQYPQCMRGGREVVGISARRDEVKPAFKQLQPRTAQQLTSLPLH